MSETNTTNPTIELLSKRRSVGLKMLTTPGPDREELTTILTIGTRVPDHGRLAPWRFIVIQADSSAADELGEAVAKIWIEKNPDADDLKLQTERSKFKRAPVTIAVVSALKDHPKVPQIEQTYSAGAVCMNLINAANALGYSTNWLTEWHAFDRDFLTRLGLTTEESLVGFIYIGTAQEPPTERERPDLDKIVTYL